VLRGGGCGRPRGCGPARVGAGECAESERVCECGCGCGCVPRYMLAYSACAAPVSRQCVDYRAWCAAAPHRAAGVLSLGARSCVLNVKAGVAMNFHLPITPCPRRLRTRWRRLPTTIPPAPARRARCWPLPTACAAQHQQQHLPHHLWQQQQQEQGQHLLQLQEQQQREQRQQEQGQQQQRQGLPSCGLRPAGLAGPAGCCRCWPASWRQPTRLHPLRSAPRAASPNACPCHTRLLLQYPRACGQPFALRPGGKLALTIAQAPAL